MAPMLLDPPLPQETTSKSVRTCSDPSVIPSGEASQRIRELWWLHGHPHSKRYSNPKLVSLGALVRHSGIAYKGQKAFLYPLTTEAATPYKSMTWDEFDRVTESIAISYAGQLENELEDANSTGKQPTVALLGGGKTIEYFCTQLALQKLGVRVLLLAEANALSALHYLLETCQALVIITDFKNSGTDTNGVRKLDMIETLPPNPATKASEVDAVKFQDFEDVWERHSFIIHSSGSTGMPKPVMHTNRSMMLIARMYRLFQEFNVENWFLLFPLYHIAGVSIAFSNLPNGQILSFPPLAWPPSSSSIFAAWKTLSSMGHPVECTHCAPTLIENMHEYITENGGDFTPLSSLKVLQPGGAALSNSIVKALTSNGVNVKTTYGSTEIGPPLRPIPHTRENPNCYSFRNLYPDNPLIHMEEVGKGVYECIIYKGFDLAADLWHDKPDDEPYRTNDLFIQDPPGSGNFTLQGRKDDILVHSNGENTSAGPLQLDIQSSSDLIHKALVLGHSKPSVSILVEVHEGYDPENKSTQNTIWEAIQHINTRYPLHSQITKPMVHYLPKGSTLPVTPKGNVRRKEAERIYSAQIDQLYADPLPTLSFSSSAEPLADYISTLLSTLTSAPASEVQPWTSFYSLGIDSRLALSLRASLSSHLNRPISLSSIFENPSIEKLVSYLTPSSSTSSNPSLNSTSDKATETTKRIISRLESEFKSWPLRTPRDPNPSDPNPKREKETVLLTGASGSLGTALLQMLSLSPRINKIYAMVRGPNHVSKLTQSLQQKGINPSILKSAAEGGSGKIEVVNFSMQDPLLGLEVEKYAEVAREVTVVVANAWKMDFNMGVEEFEADCLRCTMSLLRLCHASAAHARFCFTSSISTCMGPASPSIIPESPIGPDPTVALPTGYAQTERITQTASKTLKNPHHPPPHRPTLRLNTNVQLAHHRNVAHPIRNLLAPVHACDSLITRAKRGLDPG
ncbi:Adenylate-forming reductase [Lachnellula subtilissima]|uniref:Adenylate-forming reductase n=1 Tax=Lachnellula subtilissima TaxID=602034 RepID=A0A8H8RQ44_9HELO|nr:Adenylate-forming reductase [Lachnellula subtilissima]